MGEEVRRFYTVREANEALPRVSSLLYSMRQARARIVARQDELDAITEKARQNGSARHAEALLAEVEAAASTLRADYQHLLEMGIELKDLERGLLDFPAYRLGRMVYLCWLFGEPEVGWWHEIAAGFAGRQTLANF